MQPRDASPGIRLVVNGEEKECAADSLAGLLAELGLGQETVVAEHNGMIVRRADFAAVRLAAGDRLEIVHFVGGG